MIIRRYHELYEVFFEERELISEGRYHDVLYEDLERDPVGQVRQIYERLNLPGFGAAQIPLQRYVDSIKSYHKNQYPELPQPLRREIARSWKRNFESWGYLY